MISSGHVTALAERLAEHSRSMTRRSANVLPMLMSYASEMPDVVELRRKGVPWPVT